jgi:transposase
MTIKLNKVSRSNDTSSLTNLKGEFIRYGVGFDVHKHSISVCVAGQLKSGETAILKDQNFVATPKGLIELNQFLKKYQPVAHYLMECTGVYHLPLYHSLQKAFPDDHKKIIAMNPLLLNRRLTDLDSHNDKVDARGLARISFYSAMLRPSYVGNETFFRMRDLIRSYHRSKIHCGRLRQRILRNLSSINCKFDFQLSTEWGLHLLDYFANKEWTLHEAYNQLISDYEEQAKPTKVIQKQLVALLPFAEINLSEELRYMIQMDLARLLQEEAIGSSFLRRAERSILSTTNTDLSNAYQRLRLIPGLGGVSAITVILELGNYYRFESWKALAKFSGVVPMLYQSGEYKSKGHINRYSNKYLRRSLTQASAALINRCSKDNDLSAFAFRQYRERGLPFKKAQIKVAQKLTRIIYHVLVLKEPYDPHYEQIQRKKARLIRRLKRKQTMLESNRTKALKRDIQDFLVTHYEFLNSHSRHYLKAGFQRVLRKAKFMSTQNPSESKNYLKEDKK